MKTTVILAVALLAGCGVTPREWSAAEKACAPHKGIFFVYGGLGSARFEVRCNDGTQIEGPAPERKPTKEGA